MPDVLFTAPKGSAPPPWPIRALLIFTCSGVSFATASNDGQKGMGLIMLILIGTVPTAYALNHAVTAKDVQAFVTSSQAADQVINKHVDQSAVMGADARATVTQYIATKQLQPDTMLALRELVNDLSNEVALYKEYKSVPASQQTNVRNDMYVASEAIRLMLKSKNPQFHRGRDHRADEVQDPGEQGDEVHSRMGEGGRGAGAGTGHHGGLEAHRGDGGREDRQGAPDLCAGRVRGAGGDGDDHGRGQLRAAGIDNARAELGRGGNDGGEQERLADLDDPQHCGGVGVHAAGGGAAFGIAVLAVPADLALDLQFATMEGVRHGGRLFLCARGVVGLNRRKHEPHPVPYRMVLERNEPESQAGSCNLCRRRAGNAGATGRIVCR